MKLSLPINNLTNYLEKQLNNFFPDGDAVNIDIDLMQGALKRIDYCFSHVTLKNYRSGSETNFNHLYSDHYVMFLWFIANEIYKKKGNNNISNKLYYLNKSLNGFDCVYDTKLPDIFLVLHGVGTMLGKATYSDFFVTFQGCTIGANKGNYPVMGKGVGLTAHSSIIGNCKVNNRVSVSSYSPLFEKDVSSDNVVYRESKTGAIVIKPSEHCFAQQFFNVNLKEFN